LNRHPFDVLYLERLRAGDSDTERHFFAYFSDLIRVKVRARGMAAALDDIRQETFIRVLRTIRSRDGLRDAGALGAFVNAVCGNVMLETGRAQKYAGAEPPSDSEGAPDPATPDAESQYLTEERKRAVRAVIDRMEPRDRELLSALFLEDQDRDDVCERMGVSREYLRVLVYRAKLEFKARYLARNDRRAAAASAPVVPQRKGVNP
jgi:RNA polymerase sigma-70 factor (ECF subfamily)